MLVNHLTQEGKDSLEADSKGLAKVKALEQSILKIFQSDSISVREKRELSATLKDAKLVNSPNRDKKIFNEILPNFLLKTDSTSTKVFVQEKFGTSDMEKPFKLSIIPELLIFYSFIALSVGIFVEFGLSTKSVLNTSDGE